MADIDLAVTLRYASGEHGSLHTAVEDLSSDTALVTEGIDAVESRTRAIADGLDTNLANDPQPSLWDVSRTTSDTTWEEVLDRARSQLGDTQPTLDSLLTTKEVARIDRRHGDGFSLNTGLDRFDVLAAIAAGVTGAFLDYLVVAIPTESSLTKAMRSLSMDQDNWLAGFAKVPYDRVAGIDIDGFSPMAHRAQTFGHDPLLGWVYGTMDILRGSLTGVSRSGVMQTIQVGEAGAQTLPAALAIQAMHLISDVVTHAGLQLPGWSALLTIDQTLPGGQHSVAELSRWMYIRGYDTWHLPTLAVPLLGIEAVLRGYIGLRKLLDEEYKEALAIDRARTGSDRVGDLPRFVVMSLIASGVAAAGNAGRFALSGANPLTLNYVLWLRFARSLLGTLDVAPPAETQIGQSNMNRLMLNAAWDSLNGQDIGLPTISG